MQITFIQVFTLKIINLSRSTKKFIAIILDMVLCLLATWIALSIRLGEMVDVNWEFSKAGLLSVVIAIPLFFLWGNYKVIFRYINSDILPVLTKAVSVYTIIYSSIVLIATIPGIPRSIGLMQPMIMFLLVGSSRWLVKIWLNQYFAMKSNKKLKKEVIIYGAGETGRQLASNLLLSQEYKLLFFVDDNEGFWGGTIDGYSVKSVLSLSNMSSFDKPKELWLAMPKLSTSKRGKLINELTKLRLHVRTLPSFSDLTNRRVHLSDIRELDFNELVGRDSVEPNANLLQKCIFEKTVLITGAGGSIGSEICRQVLESKPKFILLIENSELALYNIHSELKSIIKKNDHVNETILVPLLVNIQDQIHLEQIFATWKPFTVYHAAAYKHVPMVEHNVVAGIKNNVMGTITCANVAMKHNVKHFVLISTDKAVRPTNVMGASKRLAEMSLQLMSNDPNNKFTCFCMVRFGNVLGSSGSVVPLFRKQIENEGPVTLTDKKVTRYFMSLKEAAQLVIQAGSMSSGGEVFVLDMGKPIPILELAKKMIETAGLQIKSEKTPWGDIEILVTGLRPGEKLYEELLIGNNPKPTMHSRILQANEIFLIKGDFNKLIKKLDIYLNDNNVTEIKNLLQNNISGYLPSKDVDWISRFDNDDFQKQNFE